MWQRKQYEDAAAQIGKQYSDSNGEQSINELSVKVARDNNLNPDGIRTLVRLANVSAFQNIFDKTAGDDRMIEYQVGEPELVISQLYDETKTAAVISQETPNAYDRSSDYWGDIPTLEKLAATEDSEEREIAEEELEEESEADAPVVDKKRVKLLFNKAKDEIEEEAKEAELGWVSTIEKAAQTLRVVAGSTPHFDKLAFDKDMIAAGGEDIVTEVKALSLFTGTNDRPLCGGMKVATVLEHHAPVLGPNAQAILGYLKEASVLRAHRTKCKNGLQELEQKMEALS